MTLFLGQHTQRVDRNGRVSVPAAFSKLLEGEDSRLVLLPPVDPTKRYLDVSSGERYDDMWATKEYELSKMLDSVAPEKKAALQATITLWKNHFGANAENVFLDKLGRFVLGPRLRHRCGVSGGGQVVFVGRGHSFRIYHPDQWSEETLPSTEAALALATIGGMELL